MGFQRARSAEQREERRRAILGTAEAMLREAPVADLTLTALARGSCLAKSAVLRYFDSREAVLLELLVAEWQALLTELAERLPAAVTADDPGARREELAGALAEALAARPVLCDLAAAQAAVLERNVSPGVVARFKRAAIAATEELADLVRARLPELTAESAFAFAGALALTTGALWAHSQPSAAMLAAYDSDPELATLRLDFTGTLRELLAVLLAGLAARAG
ncbi:TetR family transcriptional regulator [Pseudonocardia halophobica]|uniref:TetR family transcriptional regulator n=1 Tax=Pseudonocardia halophobica TaxID=29401 RepID=A0A9W6NWM9_9PSEU|nr:TetR family transcriptional regulator [Pseudonocardia halophobica]GLL11622.1 TetR family transcriptional regulator [Pseudonocardia halophobica]